MSQNPENAVGTNQATDTTDSLLLDTIAQAIEILRLFAKGATDASLREYLQNETSLSRAYLLYFKQMGWIECEESSCWHLTNRGKEILALFTNEDKIST